LNKGVDKQSDPWYNMWAINLKNMQIRRSQLRELQELQEDMAAFFTDENMISGETYWTCVESLAEVKLAELRGEIIFSE